MGGNAFEGGEREGGRPHFMAFFGSFQLSGNHVLPLYYFSFKAGERERMVLLLLCTLGHLLGYSYSVPHSFNHCQNTFYKCAKLIPDPKKPFTSFFSSAAPYAFI